MVFTPKHAQPEFGSLKSTLSQIKSKKDAALYNVIEQLIDRLGKLQTSITGDITNINRSVNNVSFSMRIAAQKLKTYLTREDERLDLPNSYQLLPGAGVSFDDTTPGQLIIRVSGGGGGIVPMSTGAEPLEIMSDGAGSVFLVGFSE
jgi:hypothetical protein